MVHMNRSTVEVKLKAKRFEWFAIIDLYMVEAKVCNVRVLLLAFLNLKYITCIVCPEYLAKWGAILCILGTVG